MWLRNRNIVDLSLRNVETFLLLFFFPWQMNCLQGSSSGQIRNFRGSSPLAVFGKTNVVGSDRLIIFF